MSNSSHKQEDDGKDPEKVSLLCGVGHPCQCLSTDQNRNARPEWVGIVVTYNDLDSDLAYQIVKTVCKDHLDEFKQCHAQAENLTTVEMSKGMSIPWHPGAAKFWKEVGVLK